ncbi:MAG: hypothetical protein RMM53_07225 [Bacteroidia bacterium]|nr:hypothetical protein [Bacteroidia bacterium]
MQIKVRNGLLIRFLVLTLYFGAALWAGRHVLNRGGVGEIFVFFGVGLVGASAAFVMWIYRFHAACERFLEQLVRVRQQLDQNQNRPQALSN